MMRLFIAVNFSDEAKHRIGAVQEQIKKTAERGNYSLPENLHLTLVFLGETAEEHLPAIQDAMVHAVSAGEKPVPAFNLIFSKAGFFKRGGKELWHLEADNKNSDGFKQLTALQSRLVSELAARNFSIDSRPFSPHITLGREIIRGP